MTSVRETATDNAGEVDSLVARRGKDNVVSGSDGHAIANHTTRLLGLDFDDRPLDAVAASLVADARNNRKRCCYFVNAHCVNVAARDEDYAAILANAPALYADGFGMAIAGRLTGAALHNNVNGTDLLPVLCRAAAESGVSLALLGGKPGIAERCAGALEDAYPGLDVAWHEHGYLPESDEVSRVEALNDSGARILLVAKGVPIQEKWIERFRDRVNVPVILGVGALLDFYSGNVRRAPAWVRRLRSEWIFRLLLEPRRMFSRYVIGNPVFLARVALWRLGARLPWARSQAPR